MLKVYESGNEDLQTYSCTDEYEYKLAYAAFAFQRTVSLFGIERYTISWCF